MNNNNNSELINHLRERFTENFNTLNKLDITERVFLTKVVGTPNDDIIHAINTVSEECMLMLEYTPSYVDIINILYTSAVTVNMYLNCAKKRKLKIEKPQEKRWIVNLEEKINSIRRRLSHVQSNVNKMEVLQNTNLISNINYKKSTGVLVLEI